MNCSNEGCAAVKDFVKSELTRRGSAAYCETFEEARNLNVYVRLRPATGAKMLELPNAQVRLLDEEMKREIVTFLDMGLNSGIKAD